MNTSSLSTQSTPITKPQANPTPTSPAATAAPVPYGPAAPSTVKATAVAPPGPPKNAAPVPQVVSNAGLAQKDLAAKQAHVDALGQDLTNQSQAKAQSLADQKAQTAAIAAMPPAPPAPKPTPTAEDIAASVLKQSGVTTDQTTTDTTATAAQSSPTDQYTAALDNINNQTDQAYQQYQQAMTQLQNGTFPLTADQQGQVDAANSLLQQTIQDQKDANASYQAGITKAGAVSGRNMYAPEVQMGQLKSAIDQGIRKVATLEATALDNISKLKQGFQDQDYKQINDSYDALTKALDSKSATISNIYKAVQDHADKVAQQNADAEKQANLEQQQQIDNQLKQQSNDLASAKQAADQKIAMANSLGYWTDADGNKISTEQAVKDANDQLNNTINNSLKQAQFNLDTQKEAFSEEQAADPLGLAGNPQTVGSLVDSGIANSLSDGSTYLDVSQFSDSKQKAAAEKLARQAGVPIISSTAEKAGLTSIDTEMASLKNLGALFQQIAPADAAARIGQSSTNWAAEGADTDHGALIRAYQALTGVELPGLVKAVTGLNRVNTTELQSSATALPSITPTTMDTWKDAQLKLSNLYDVLNANKKAMLDNKEVYADPVSYYSNASQEQKDYFDKAKAANPDWSPDEVLQFVQSGSNFSQVGGDTHAASTSGARTDRNNNPTAMTTDVAKTLGLVEGKDYVQSGDTFDNGRYQTAKLLGDPVATTIKAIDNGGFQTASGKPRWDYINMPKAQWDRMTYDQKKATVGKMYQREGGTALKSVFV